MLLDAGASQVPDLPPSVLSDIPSGVPSEHVRKLRVELAQRIEKVRAFERSARREHAAALRDQVAALNRERLALLPYLSASKRNATTGLTAAGWELASAEGRHLALVSRYERHVTHTLIADWRGDDAARARPSLSSIVLLAVPWLAQIAAFVWFKRRTAAWLRVADLRLAAQVRLELRTTRSPLRHVVRMLSQLRLPIAWSLLFAASLWLLPEAAHGLLEVQLLSTIVWWTISMSVVVNTINALAGAKCAAWHEEDRALNALRRRSLRLVGRTFVVFALVLMLSERLVGEGTIHSWVETTCWLVALPVFVVRVRWWRGVVFERVAPSSRAGGGWRASRAAGQCACAGQAHHRRLCDL